MEKSCFSKADTVVDVYDRYNEKQSIKSAERTRRTGSLSSQKVFQVIEGRLIPDWKRFLGVDVNKQALLAFLGEYTTRYYSELGDMPYPGDSLYIAGPFTDPNVAKKISSVGVSSCADLYCSHEEADTRMLLHAMHADKEFGRKNTKGRIIVKSPDTDVFVLCVHFFPSMSNTKELWFQTGTITRTKDCRRYLPVHDICSMLGSVLACLGQFYAEYCLLLMH